MYRVRDSEFLDSLWYPDWSVEVEQRPYLIALYVESDIHTTITDASMSEDADHLHTNKYSIPYRDGDMWGADWDVDIEAGSWILCWEDKLNVDTGWHADGSDWDYRDLVVVMKPVPEPSTVILLLVGIVGLLGVKSRMNCKIKRNV